MAIREVNHCICRYGSFDPSYQMTDLYRQFSLLTKWEVCYTKQFELPFRFSHDFLLVCFWHILKNTTFLVRPKLLIAFLLQQPVDGSPSSDVLLIEEERTLFSTADPFQDIKDLSSTKMDSIKVMIFNYGLIL